MKVNNIRNEIKEFLKDFATIVIDLEKDSEYNNVSGEYIEYKNETYFIPDDCSLMTEDDELLKEMLLTTFGL